jgi:hypothetical protein
VQPINNSQDAQLQLAMGETLLTMVMGSKMETYA